METFSPKFLRNMVFKLSMGVAMETAASQDTSGPLSSRQRLLFAVVNPTELELVLRILSPDHRQTQILSRRA